MRTNCGKKVGKKNRNQPKINMLYNDELLTSVFNQEDETPEGGEKEEGEKEEEGADE